MEASTLRVSRKLGLAPYESVENALCAAAAMRGDVRPPYTILTSTKETS